MCQAQLRNTLNSNNLSKRSAQLLPPIRKQRMNLSIRPDYLTITPPRVPWGPSQLCLNNRERGFIPSADFEMERKFLRDLDHNANDRAVRGRSNDDRRHRADFALDQAPINIVSPESRCDQFRQSVRKAA